MVRDLEQLKENEEKQIQLAVDADGVTVVTTTTTVKNANGKTASTVTSSVSGNSAVNIANAVNASPLELIAQTVTSTVCGANGGHQCKYVCVFACRLGSECCMVFDLLHFLCVCISLYSIKSVKIKYVRSF